jgi:methionyl aminopeptidase
VLEMIAPQVEVGMTTGEIDRICHDYIVNVQQSDSRAAQLQRLSQIDLHLSERGDLSRHSLGQQKACANGDIINIDVTVIKDGWHGDTSIMVGVGDVAPHAERLMRSRRNASTRRWRWLNPAQRWAIWGM